MIVASSELLILAVSIAGTAALSLVAGQAWGRRALHVVPAGRDLVNEICDAIADQQITQAEAEEISIAVGAVIAAMEGEGRGVTLPTEQEQIGTAMRIALIILDRTVFACQALADTGEGDVCKRCPARVGPDSCAIQVARDALAAAPATATTIDEEE